MVHDPRELTYEQNISIPAHTLNAGQHFQLMHGVVYVSLAEKNSATRAVRRALPCQMTRAIPPGAN